MFQRLWDWIRGKKPKFYFPAGYEAEGRAALERAGLIVRGVIKLPKRLGGNLYFVKAHGRMGGVSYFYHPKWPGWPVAGYCQQRGGGKVDIVVADPPDGGTVLHEFGHGWLFQAGIYGHDPRFDQHFEGWAETRRATGVTVGGREPPPLPTHIDTVDTDGLHTHIDIIAAPVYAGADGGTANA